MLTAQQQVNDAISTFLQSRIQVGDFSRSVQAARGALDIATDQYEQGATTFTTVQVAEQNLFLAESNLATASGNAALGLTAIYRALGGGWQIRNDSYFVDASTNEQMRAYELGKCAATGQRTTTASFWLARSRGYRADGPAATVVSLWCYFSNFTAPPTPIRYR